MTIPNLQHSDKWSLILSNLPGYHPEGTNTDNIQLFELYVKEFTLPALSLDLVQSRFRNYQINHQISQINDSLSEIEITFKVSEGLLNYTIIRDHLQNQREELNADDKELFRYNCITELKLMMLDNEKRPKFRYGFINCFITNLSALTLTQGIDEELSFTITIKYEDYSMEKVEGC